LQHKPVIKPFGSPFIELLTVDSTNNYALSQSREGKVQHGTAIFAHEQTAGKGQMGRQWLTEKGANMALSIVLQPKRLQLSQQFQLSACIAVAVHKFYSNYAGDDTKIKWPNDLYWKDRKAGGILIESIVGSGEAGGGSQESGAGSWKWAIAGIGLNINQTQFSPDLPNPVSLKQITGKNFDAVQLAKELCSSIDKYFARLINNGFPNIYEEYNNCLYKINEQVKLKKSNSVFSTTIKGVSSTGQLITHNNSMEELFGFGEVTWTI
jgi:BirA family transcriptional regulator, biotin operon repressor / biotin---[acetyl-CoA-carboxylase] ligase